MQFIHGLAILLVYQLVGEVSVHLLDIPVPGPVLGMALLFLTLLVRGGVTASLDGAANGLLSHLSLLFVPAGVGMMVHVHRIGEEWLPILVALVLSTVLTLVVTAAVMLAAQRLVARGTNADE